MPSPIGHALAGIAAGWLVAGAPSRLAWNDRRTLLFGSVAVVPDLDLFAGAHSGPTHGLGAAAIAGFAVWIVGRVLRLRGAGALAAACGAAYASHTLLDWLGTDSSPPIGIMALWPFSRDYFESALHLFRAVSRRYWQPERFWVQNVRALVQEIAILVPLALGVFLLRKAPSTQRAGVRYSGDR